MLTETAFLGGPEPEAEFNCSWGQIFGPGPVVGGDTSSVGGSYFRSTHESLITRLVLEPGGRNLDTCGAGEVAFKTVKGLCVPGARTSNLVAQVGSSLSNMSVEPTVMTNSRPAGKVG